MAPSHILIVDDDSLSRELVADLLGLGVYLPLTEWHGD